ncbi:MAG: PspC domain-containing protein [Candidatus Dormiibacterota bacterium]
MQPPTEPRFHRSSDRIIGGVCSGLAEGFHVDPLWVRLAFVALAFVQGVGVVLYFVLWVIMPEDAKVESSSRSGMDSFSADLRRLWSELVGMFGGSRPATKGPMAPADSTAAPESQEAPAVRTGLQNPPVVLGLILVVIGLLFLANNLGFFNWDVFWPAVLIALGVLLLIRNLQRKA